MNTTYQSPRYISVADTAKLIRQELKVHFPGIKFSVKSHNYSMGGHVSVSYTDGPTEEQVNAAIRQYDGSTFDGMIDLKSYHNSTLNGESVHFANDGTNVSRSYSLDFLTKAVAYLCKRYGYALPTIKASAYDGAAYIVEDPYIEDRQCHLRTLLWREYKNFPADCIENLEAVSVVADWLNEMAYRVYYPLIEAKKAREREQELEELLPRLRAQLEGFTACNDTRAVEVLTKAIAKAEAELATYTPPEQPAPIIQAVVTIIEELPYNEKRVRVLLAGEHTPFRALIGGEMAFYLKRYNAVLVDNATFDEVLNNRVAQ